MPLSEETVGGYSETQWTLPNTNIAIFEWDEDYLRGSHYHVMLPSWKGKHISDQHGYEQAGDFVPEPWRSTYFK